jgi:hypothetical protein
MATQLPPTPLQFTMDVHRSVHTPFCQFGVFHWYAPPNAVWER